MKIFSILALFCIFSAIPSLALEQNIQANQEFEESNITSFNVRTNTHGLFRKYWNLDFDFPLSDSMTLGPTFKTYKSTRFRAMYFGDVRIEYEDSKMTAWGLGARLNWYPISSRTKSGLVLSPYFRVLQATVSGTNMDIPVSDSFTAADGGLNVAYQIAWSNGINLTFGGGAGYLMGFPDKIKNDQAELRAPSGVFNTRLTLNLDASVGFMF